MPFPRVLSTPLLIVTPRRNQTFTLTFTEESGASFRMNGVQTVAYPLLDEYAEMSSVLDDAIDEGASNERLVAIAKQIHEAPFQSFGTDPLGDIAIVGGENSHQIATVTLGGGALAFVTAYACEHDGKFTVIFSAKRPGLAMLSLVGIVYTAAEVRAEHQNLRYYAGGLSRDVQ